MLGVAMGWGLGSGEGQCQTPPTASPAAASVQPTLSDALRMLQTHNSISARIRHRFDLFGKKLVGDGAYLEQRRNGIPAIRVELKIQVGDDTSTLLQVCDGRYCWTHRKLMGKESLSRIDAVRAMTAISQLETPAEPGGGDLLPALGGLPRLLRGLNANFQFIAVDGQIGNLPVWQFEGGWRTPQLLRMLPKQREAIEQGKPADLTRLPDHVPDHVVLLLRRDDLFPHRLEYCRTVVKKDGDRETREVRNLLTMEFLDVYFNVPLDPVQFTYNPGSVEWSDQTEAFLQGIGAKK
jgi:hypothetical protein